MAIVYKNLQTQASNADVQRKNNFSMTFPNYLGSDMQLYLESFPFPKQGNVVKDVRTGNMVSKYAGAFEAAGNVVVKYREYLDRKTSQALFRWRTAVGSLDTGAINRSSSYKQTGTLTKFAPDGETVDQQVWTLSGCWLSDYQEDDYDQGNDGDLVLVSCNLVVEGINTLII